MSKVINALRIYLASSWRNPYQPSVLAQLRADGHEVYDFRNPGPSNKGFAWSEIDPNWQAWAAKDYVRLLNHPLAEKGFANDFNAMKWCDVIVLLLPCGRSAHLEAGWGCGAGKGVFVLTRDGEEPELMAKMATGIATDIDELLNMLAEFREAQS